MSDGISKCVCHPTLYFTACTVFPTACAQIVDLQFYPCYYPRYGAKGRDRQQINGGDTEHGNRKIKHFSPVSPLCLPGLPHQDWLETSAMV